MKTDCVAPPKILIAESKSMCRELYPFSPEGAVRPMFEDAADRIMAMVSAMTPSEASAMLRSSLRIGITAVELARDFVFRNVGRRALEAFTGVVFRTLDAGTMPAEACSRCRDQVRIISSAYGLLRPDDVIRPYRLEMGAIIPGFDLSLKKFWRPKVTVSLGKWIKENPQSGLITVLPADAAYCLDMKLLRGLGRVAVIELRTYGNDGRLVSPRAERLKNRRGLFVRQLLERGISSVDELDKFSSADFQYLGQQPYPGHYMFLC